MKSSLFHITIPCLIIAFLGIFPSSQDNKAKEELKQASELVKLAQQAEQTSYSDAFKLYKEAVTKVESITSKYPSSKLAGKIRRGKAKIERYRINEFKETIVPQAEMKADAEQSPLACAVLVAKTMADGLSKAWALAEIAGKYIQMGQKDNASEILSHALGIAETIDSADAKVLAVAIIAVKYAEADQCQKALEVSGTIENVRHLKPWALASIASQYAKAGPNDNASETFSQAIEIAKTIRNPAWKGRALAEIAAKYAEVEQYDRGLEIGKTIERADWRAKALAEIAGKYAGASQKDNAPEILAQALQVAKKVDDDDQKVWVLTEIAGKYAQAGQKDKASEILSLALEVAKAMQDGENADWDKVRALTEIAGVYAEAGQKDKATEILSLALEITETIENPHSKNFALHPIPGKYAEAGEYEQALQVAKKINVSYFRDFALVQIADEYIEVGQYEQALKVAKTIGISDNKARALFKIAYKYAETEEEVDDKTRSILHEIIRYAEAVQ